MFCAPPPRAKNGLSTDCQTASMALETGLIASIVFSRIDSGNPHPAEGS